MTFVSIRGIRMALLGGLLAMASLPRPSSAQVGGIAVGVQAPAVSVETLEGQSVSLARYAEGKPMLLEFWATWCPLCKELEPAMEAAKEKYGDRVRFVGVGVPQNQTPERQRAYVEKAGLKGAFVFDRNQEALAAFQVPHTSFVVVVDADGKVVYTGQGPDQDLEAALAKALMP